MTKAKDLKRFADLYKLMMGGATVGEREAARAKLAQWLERNGKSWGDVGLLVAETEAANLAGAQAAENDQRRASTEPAPGHDQFHALELVHHLLGTYLDLKDHERIAVALWVLYTHVFNRFTISPRLALLSPTNGCGKTETFKLLGLLCARPEQIDATSVAALYWLIDEGGPKPPTILLDEGDNLGLLSNPT